MTLEKIIINYSGWIEVDKEDLKVQYIDDKSGDLLDADTSIESADSIVSKLKSGKYCIKSFGETYANNALDGEDDFAFDFEID